MWPLWEKYISDWKLSSWICRAMGYVWPEFAEIVGSDRIWYKYRTIYMPICKKKKWEEEPKYLQEQLRKKDLCTKGQLISKVLLVSSNVASVFAI